MSEHFFAFDRVLVMDSLALTGTVLCDLADEAAERPCSELLSSLSALHQRLAALCASQPEARVLIITELLDQRSSLQEGIAMLDALQGLCQGGTLSGDGVHGADRPASTEGGRKPQSGRRGTAPGIAGRTATRSADGGGGVAGYRHESGRDRGADADPGGGSDATGAGVSGDTGRRSGTEDLGQSDEYQLQDGGGLPAKPVEAARTGAAGNVFMANCAGADVRPLPTGRRHSGPGAEENR